MVNINVELFKRYKPENKLAIIDKLTTIELFNVSPETILRCIKEAGNGDSRKARSRYKNLRLKNRVGNGWNSTVECIYNGKKDAVYLSVYIQGDDTDTICECRLSALLNGSDYDITFAELNESFRNGYSHTVIARYDKEDRARVIREILKSYVYLKYNI